MYKGAFSFFFLKPFLNKKAGDKLSVKLHAIGFKTIV
jgi:hypothetical protein